MTGHGNLQVLCPFFNPLVTRIGEDVSLAPLQQGAGLGVRISRVMTHNGSGYKNAFKTACAGLGIRQLCTKPYTPKTNGKVERFVQTCLLEWACARPYESSAQREAALQPVIHRYNWHRPHSAIHHQPPMNRIPAMSSPLKLNTQRL